jgi:hypothetical protein
MEKLNHRIWCCDLMENRELLSVKRNAYGDILFELDGGLTRQFTPHSVIDEFALERVHILGRMQDSITKKPSMIASLVLQNPRGGGTGNIRDIQTPVPEPSKGKTKPRLEVTVKDAAKKCDVSVSTIKKWEQGESTPVGYPGRFNLVAFGMWQQTRASKKVVKDALKRKALGGELSIEKNQHKEWQTNRDAETRREEDE